MPDIAANRPIRWMPDYAIGITEIDQEHEGLFSIAEEFRLALRDKDNVPVLTRILEKLISYTQYHFEHEERLMEEIGYPHFQDHCRQHEVLRTGVHRLSERAVSGDTSVAIELTDLIVDWLKGHTTTSDRRIGVFMRKSGLAG